MGAVDGELEKIAHISLPLGKENILMASDVLGSTPMTLTVGNNFHITLEADSEAEADSLFDALAAGGRIDMPLQKTEWAEKYGICADRFGVQ